MNRTDKAQRLVKNFRIYLIAAWTILILGFIVFAIHVSRKKIEEEARIQVSTLFEQNLVYRRWAASHGGVYVPVTDTFKPNPYLITPNRDLTATNGMKLTLVNPAWMTRQVFELFNKQMALPIINRLTSLKYLNPANKPDEWEENALLSFEKGQSERSDIKVIHDQPYMRFMKPIVTEKGCLKCHGHQGYKIGDIRGGISVSIPMKPYYDALSAEKRSVIISYSAFWAIGLGFILVFTGKVSGQQKKIIESKDDLEKKNEKLSLIYQVSSATSKTMDMDTLLADILHIITRTGVFSVEHKGGIFLVKDEKMVLVSHLGHTQQFLDAHSEMKIGDCLCGLVAKTGEILISRNSDIDTRHTITFPDMKPHGHIIIPLKTINKIIGVLYLYVPADIELSEELVKTLLSIGEVAGIAINSVKLYEETKDLSLHDPLTGLGNRRLMEITLENLFESVKRYGRDLSAIMLDIDFFKKYNDTYGHPAGDQLLAVIAKILLGEIRKSDIAVRYGGEEFIVLLPETNLKDACDAAERIRKSIESKAGITVSLGVSSFHRDMQDKESLIKQVDHALYQAKQKGRNRVEVD